MGHSIEYQTCVAESGQDRAIRERVLQALDLRPPFLATAMVFTVVAEVADLTG